jgi:hypothetical protein
MRSIDPKGRGGGSHEVKLHEDMHKTCTRHAQDMHVRGHYPGAPPPSPGRQVDEPSEGEFVYTARRNRLGGTENVLAAKTIPYILYPTPIPKEGMSSPPWPS